MSDKQRSPYPLAIWTGIFFLFTVYAFVNEAELGFGLPDWMIRTAAVLATLFLLGLTIAIARNNEN